MLNENKQPEVTHRAGINPRAGARRSLPHQAQRGGLAFDEGAALGSARSSRSLVPPLNTFTYTSPPEPSYRGWCPN